MKRKLDWLQPAVLVGSLVPFVVLAVRATRGQLGANPIATALNQLGLLTLLFLLASLACTPLKIVFQVNWPLRLRKTLGLMAFWSALSHFMLYAAVDQAMVLPAIVEDIATRPFILAGAAGLLVLLPLAWTSTRGARRRLGARRWQQLHRLAYLAGVLGVVHYLLRVKRDVREPIVYGAVLVLLLTIRAIAAWRRRAYSAAADGS